MTHPTHVAIVLLLLLQNVRRFCRPEAILTAVSASRWHPAPVGSVRACVTGNQVHSAVSSTACDPGAATLASGRKYPTDRCHGNRFWRISVLNLGKGGTFRTVQMPARRTAGVFFQQAFPEAFVGSGRRWCRCMDIHRAVPPSAESDRMNDISSACGAQPE